jgi:outer membrane receptor protein involved in Fe transport
MSSAPRASCSSKARTPKWPTTASTNLELPRPISSVPLAGTPLSSAISPRGADFVPELGIQGINAAGEEINLTPFATDNTGYQGSITQIIGNHTVKFGLGWVTTGFASTINYTQLGFNDPQTSAPQFPSQATGNGLASFLLNVPQSAQRRNVDELERPGGVLSAYLQDSWKATPRLTLNYGLRYDYTFIPGYGASATIGKNGGPETGDMDWDNGTYIVQLLPPACSVRGLCSLHSGKWNSARPCCGESQRQDKPQRAYQLRAACRLCL